MEKYTIPVIAGDGVGPEIIVEGKKVLTAAARRFGFGIDWLDLPHGAEYYLATGQILPDEVLEELGRHRAVYLGAVGDPRVAPGLLEMGIILKIRFHFDQFVNLRPVRLFDGVEGPLRNKTSKDVNLFIIRENTEDFYLGLGGRAPTGVSREILSISKSLYHIEFDINVRHDADEIAYNLGLISRRGAERVVRYGFELARKSGLNRLSLIDKANVIPHMYGLWREVAEKVAGDYPDIEFEIILADAAMMWLVKNPERFQVVVAPNLFGDIITDLSAVIGGGLGLCPSGNINPDGVSMFEPMHGSAPKYKDRNLANPLAAILSGGMMLDFLGQKEAAGLIISAVSEMLREKRTTTPDLGGRSTTSQVGDALVGKILNGCQN